MFRIGERSRTTDESPVAVQREMNGCRIIIDLVEFVFESLLYHEDARSHETRVFETPLLER